MLLGALAAIVACRVMGIEWRHVGDSAAPAVPVAQAIGRLGNYFKPELYGGPTDLPWALEVDDPAGYPPGTTFHPTFLYEGLWNVALAIGIVLAGRRVVLKPGRWFAVYVAGYGLGRLWVESLRIDFATEVLGLRVNIWISLLAIAGGLLWLFWGGGAVDHEATAELRAGGPARRRRRLERRGLERRVQPPGAARLSRAAGAVGEGPGLDGPGPSRSVSRMQASDRSGRPTGRSLTRRSAVGARQRSPASVRLLRAAQLGAEPHGHRSWRPGSTRPVERSVRPPS